MRRTISDILRTILNCEISQSAGLSIGRLTAYIKIAHEDLKRTILFTPAPAPTFEPISTNSPCSVFELKPRDSSPPTSTSTPPMLASHMTKDSAPFAFPEFLRTELHTIISCPHTSHISTPLIQSIRLALN